MFCLIHRSTYELLLVLILRLGLKVIEYQYFGNILYLKKAKSLTNGQVF